MIKSLLIAAACAALSLSGGVSLASASAPLPAADVAPICAQVASPGAECVAGSESRLSESKKAESFRHTVPADRDTAAECETIANWSWVNGRCVPDSRPGHGGPVRGGPVYHGPIYNSCDDYRSHGIRDIRRGDSRWNDAWDRNRDGSMCDDGDVVVLNSDGDCTTYAVARDSIRNYGLAYNRYRTQYNSDWNRFARNTRDRDDLARLYSLSHRYESSGWNSTKLSNLRTVCKDTSPAVTIINEAPPAAVLAAPAPSDGNPVALGSGGGGQVSVKPSGGAETGDGSTVLR